MPQRKSVLRSYATRLNDFVRSSLWPFPVFAVVVAVALAIGLTAVDRAAEVNLGPFEAVAFGGDAAAARSMLETIAGSLITVTSLTFSLTVVTLQLASSQFSPRLLRTFTRDRVVQGTLALFLGTFVFALTVLRVARDRQQGSDFVPGISIALAFLLTLASVIALVLFLAHLAREIRVETLARTVGTESAAASRRVLVDAESIGVHLETPPVAAPLTLSSSGFVTGVDTIKLVRMAKDLQAVVVVDSGPGSWVVAGVPAGLAWSNADGGAGELTGTDRDRLQKRFDAAVEVEFERTSVDDPTYGLRQLTDVTVKALSPGINDPTTATHTLGHTSTLLCTLLDLPLGDQLLRDDDDVVRVVVRRPTAADLLYHALDQPSRYGVDEPQVMERLFSLLREAAWRRRLSADRDAIGRELERLRAAVAGSGADEVQTTRYAALAAGVEDALAGRWSGIKGGTSAELGVKV
ncbi:MAG: DUF2254 domain-containing protein [Microlunatus sp.]|nr:DUF2254 domain-containing protein [Microlunatus sp.]